MGKREELEIAAIRLYAEGMEIPAISRELGVSENSLRAWKKRAGHEWDDARKAARADSIAAFEDVGVRLRRSREITSQLMGDARGQGHMGLILNQAMQTMIYDLLGQIQTTDLGEYNMEATIAQLNVLTRALQRTEQAASVNLKREQEIRKQALDDVAKAVDKVEQAEGKKAMTSERLRAIIRESYGV
jgi:uncharacterized protein YjcR